MPQLVHHMTYDDWCRRLGVTHGHCPKGCEHPQPLVIGRLVSEPKAARNHVGAAICGRCWCKFGQVKFVIPCMPEIC